MVTAERIELYALIERLIDRVLKLEQRMDDESTYNNQKVKELLTKLEYKHYIPFTETNDPIESKIDEIQSKIETPSKENKKLKRTNSF